MCTAADTWTAHKKVYQHDSPLDRYQSTTTLLSCYFLFEISWSSYLWYQKIESIHCSYNLTDKVTATVRAYKFVKAFKTFSRFNGCSRRSYSGTSIIWALTNRILNYPNTKLTALLEYFINKCMLCWSSEQSFVYKCVKI